MTGTGTESLIAGRYRLGPPLGIGGMGRVWLAHDEVLNRSVAVKEIALPFGLSDNERAETRQRTLREARAAARLSHPNVVKIFDVVPGEEQPWIVMEYVRSRSLLQLIEETGPLPVERVARIGLALLAALGAAGRAGVVHRDVKPSNVLIAEDGRVVLTDFGSAVLDESEGAITRTGVIVGSPQYISPERASYGVSTPESDLWSLGATLYAAVEGRAPYARPTAMATLVALATQRPDRTRLAGPLKPVLGGLLRKNPQDRMRPAEVEMRLRRVADGRPATKRRPGPVPKPAGPPGPPAGPPSDAVVPYLHQPSPDATTLRLPSAAPSSTRPARVPRRPRRRVATAAVAVALVALVAGAVRADGTGRSPAADAVPDTGAGAGSPTATPRPSATAGAARAAPAETPAKTPTSAPADPDLLPAGFTWWAHPSGFRVAIPARWEMIREGTTEVVFCDPRDPSTLRARPFARTDPDPVAALTREEARAGLAGYQRIRLEASDSAYAAEWEYMYTSPKGRLHGVERLFVSAGRAYVIQWRTPPATWQANLPRLAVITGSFRPPGPPTGPPPAGRIT